ncbi:MAG: hypothetical protein ABEJ24_01565 [Candidatus Magasanikbacteria bacterium]
MTQIQVDNKKETGDKFIFSVTIQDEDSQSNHEVTVDKDYYQKLTNGKNSAKNLVKRSFKFLLERESKEMILSRFNLKVIQDYFSNYEDKVKQ